MSSSYLKEPILTKKTTVRSENTFTATSIEMQGISLSIQDGEEKWKMLSPAIS